MLLGDGGKPFLCFVITWTMRSREPVATETHMSFLIVYYVQLRCAAVQQQFETVMAICWERSSEGEFNNPSEGYTQQVSLSTSYNCYYIIFVDTRSTAN